MGKPAVSYIGNYSVDMIRDSGGDDLVETFKKKIAGADANKDGRDYEIIYGTCRTIIEVATLMDLLRKGHDLPDLDKYSFWDRPLALVDDYYLNGVYDHFFGQLKRGALEWYEVNYDIQRQRDMDQNIGRDVRYRIVLESEKRKRSVDSCVEADGHTDIDTEIFCASEEFYELLDWNEDIFDAFATVTGSSRLVDQETAYESFHYQYWKTRYEETFVNYMLKCSKRKEYFIPRLKRAASLYALEEALEVSCWNCKGRIVGELLRIEGAGAMRTYRIPSESAVDTLIKMLDEQIFEFNEIVERLEAGGWQRAAI
ncbi:hypothetical protein GGQ73_003633 [Rhizobium skierniewicense]|uniref:Uncharacterized protein n=1 Tax=Rhizobium skierniewicense TaxID=984260 RepID=A0A7W6C8K4_9HYPH|nr:hypothetical protein [Rhizobium skierniewicense]MBB3947665.1 hypothetical protein [Rhizobium skierniewicense]